MKFTRTTRSLLLLLPVWLFLPQLLSAQNIIGWKIMIGANAPAFLLFPTEVDNARWDNNEMNDFFKFSTRNENSMQVTYSGKGDPPATGTGFSVIQGKNTHTFTLVFKKDYDINKDPSLFYDFSDKKKLKAAAETNKGAGFPQQANGTDQPALVQVDKDTEKAEREQQLKEEERRKKEMAVAQQKKKKEIEAQQKAEAETFKQSEKTREAALAKAKAEATTREAEQKKAKEEAAAVARANEEANRKKAADMARLKKEQEAEDKKLALASAQQKEQEKQEKDKQKAARDKAAREAAEEQRRLASQAKEKALLEQQAKDEAERKRKGDLAQEQAEARRIAKEEAQAKLAQLQKEKEEAKKNAQYTLVGLWNRYGKQGINLYEIPNEQHNYNNTDFYIARDTMQNAENSKVFIAEPSRLNIVSETKKQVTLSLQSISFKGPIAYYKVQVENKGNQDYLVGTNKLAWYNPDGSAKLFLKCSYLTDIGFFPMVKPGETKSYIYATRAASIKADDRLVLFVSERRADQPSFDIGFEGTDYLKELARVERPLGTSAVKENKDPKKKENRKERKERKQKERATEE